MGIKGYMGRILRMELGDHKVKEQELPESWAQAFLDRSGLGAKILFEETVRETDPFSPENPLIFAVGPLTGTGVYNSDRFEVVTQSPLTGIYGESNLEDRFALEGKAENEFRLL